MVLFGLHDNYLCVFLDNIGSSMSSCENILPFAEPTKKHRANFESVKLISGFET